MPPCESTEMQGTEYMSPEAYSSTIKYAVATLFFTFVSQRVSLIKLILTLSVTPLPWNA